MATCFMTGVIWIVQVVHYPLFAKVGAEGYGEYQEAHMKRITWVVLPAMGIELISGLALFFPQMQDSLHWVNLGGALTLNTRLLWFNLLGLLLIWASTGLLQVPQHTKLLNGFEKPAYHKLVRWNWIRTILWSMRVYLLFYLVMSA